MCIPTCPLTVDVCVAVGGHVWESGLNVSI